MKLYVLSFFFILFANVAAFPGTCKSRRVGGCSVSKATKDDDSERSDDIFDTWDPRLSPHLYPDGLPDTSKEDKEEIEKVGVLLIDHGSRKPASNEFLHALAERYQTSSCCPPHYIVKAAHMEIAEPSIEMGLHSLVDAGVGRIVCHPYFLSPGRHATEDVPRLIEEAKISLGDSISDIPVIQTEYLGSQSDLLLDVIGSMVNTAVRTGPKKQNSDMGFFGEIMRMMDAEIGAEDISS